MKRKVTLIASMILVATFTFVAFSQAFAQRNCGTMDHLQQQLQNDPHLQQRMNLIEQQTAKYVQNQTLQGASRVSGVITIPVVVHVVYRTSSQNVSDAQIQSQIDVLNEDFRRLNADASNTPSAFTGVAADVQIEFCLASVDPNGNSTTGITRTSTSTTSFNDNDNVKFNSTGGKDAWPASDYMNLWVCNLGSSLLGYAQFPGGAASTDGVVINYRYFGRNGSAQAPFHLGRTATHEVGHWLNLRHIWGDSNCGNDLVNDTPTQQTSSSGCPSYPHVSCSSTDMTMNYMDYSDDACMNIFTAGQTSRMRALFDGSGSRVSLLSSNGCGGGTPPSGYCTSKGNDASYEWIANVQVGTINNSTGTSSGYVDYTSISTDLDQGASYSVSLSPGFSGSTYNEYWKIWIDYNQDDDFDDAGELAFDGGGLTNTTETGSFTVPSGATAGQTRMRVQMKYNAAGTQCETFSYGEVEDYTVNITTAAPPCNTPGGLSSSNVGETSATVSWSAVSGAVNYTVRYRPSGSGTWSTTTTSSTSRTLTGLSSSTTYEWQVRTNCSANNSNYTASSMFTTDTPPPAGYCGSQGNNSSYEWIANVQVGSINNSSGNDGGYEDYTGISTDLEQGSSNAVSLSPGFSGSTYNEYWKIWVDFNQDNDFDDAGELAFDGGALTNGTETGTLTVPSSATLGTTRMRVQMKYNAAGTACETFSYGEVEDYTVNITEEVVEVTYCGSQGNNSSYEWINRVIIGSIDNTSGNNGGYQDYTATSTNLAQGSSNTVTLYPGFSSSTYNEYWKIWIDFNKDGDFTDAGELAFDAGQLFSTGIQGPLTVPSGAPLGTTRMRVQMKYNAAGSSCETFSYGEVEDYTVNIVSGSRVNTHGMDDVIGLGAQLANEKINFDLFPNPTSSTAMVQLELPRTTMELNLRVMDVQGKVVFQQQFMETDRLSYQLPVNDLPAGVYHVSISSAEYHAVKKLVVVK